MKPLKIAVIGAGTPNIATSNHLPVLAGLDSVNLVTLCDINEEGVKKYAEQYGAKWYTDFEDVLKDPEVEAVDICTPDWLHARQVVSAARAGKHVICEKPIAMNMEEARQMAHAVESNGITFMAAHMRRFQPMTQCIKNLIERGELGQIIYARMSVKGAFFPYPKGSPYYKKEMRGQFLHNGPHYVDTLCHFVDSRPIRVHGATRRFYPDPDEAMEMDNFTTATIRFENGAIGSVEQNLTMLNPRGYPTREQIMLIGTKATITWNSTDDATLVQYTNGSTSYLDPNIIKTRTDPYAAELDHFAECVRTGQKPITDIAESIKSLSICLGALDSAERGHPIALQKGI
ncbi:MAG: Gfo/Idh/MocA family oxidoreductase [Phycisphaerae bacterium]|nr:Gfo/Idh/MocA family oxidoreductase [Phycisphaerae bacterium]